MIKDLTLRTISVGVTRTDAATRFSVRNKSSPAGGCVIVRTFAHTIEEIDHFSVGTLWYGSALTGAQNFIEDVIWREECAVRYIRATTFAGSRVQLLITLALFFTAAILSLVWSTLGHLKIGK